MKAETKVEDILPGDAINEHLVLEVNTSPESELIILVITSRQTHHKWTTLQVERPNSPSLYDKERPIWRQICQMARHVWEKYWDVNDFDGGILK